MLTFYIFCCISVFTTKCVDLELNLTHIFLLCKGYKLILFLNIQGCLLVHGILNLLFFKGNTLYILTINCDLILFCTIVCSYKYISVLSTELGTHLDIICFIGEVDWTWLLFSQLCFWWDIIYFETKYRCVFINSSCQKCYILL